MSLRQCRERLLPRNYFPAMGTINHQEVTRLKISAKITTTIGAAAIVAMLAVPAMANTTTSGSFLAGNGLGIGNDLGDTLLLVRGGNGNGGGRKGSGRESGDRDGSGSGDRDRGRDSSCDDGLASNGHQNGHQNGDQDGEPDRDRNGSCLDSITSPNPATSTILAGNGNGSGNHDHDHDHDRDASCQV